MTTADVRAVVPAVLPPELCRELWFQHLACAVPGYRRAGDDAAEVSGDEFSSVFFTLQWDHDYYMIIWDNDNYKWG